VREEFEELSAQHSYCPPRHKHAPSRENEGVQRLSLPADSTAFLNSVTASSVCFLFVVPAENHLFQASVAAFSKPSSANWMELSY